MVCIVAHTIVDIEDVGADEPDEVGEVGCSRLVRHKLQHGLVLNLQADKRVANSVLFFYSQILIQS